jgi:hypothetical protein
MEHTTPTPLTTVQQCVVNALAAGSTITGAAEAYDVHRVTIYRWIKTLPQFSATLHRARAEFVLARRDDLHLLSNRALETLLAILDNPKSSPAVLLRTAMFILQRPQVPKTGWSMPEPAPDPDGKKLIDSAVIEQDYDGLPGLYNIEKEEEADAPAEPDPPEPPPAAESPAPPPASDVSESYAMQHDSGNCDDVAPAAGQTGLPSRPAVPEARHDRAQYPEILDTIGSDDAAIQPQTEKQDRPTNAGENETEEILV